MRYLGRFVLGVTAILMLDACNELATDPKDRQKPVSQSSYGVVPALAPDDEPDEYGDTSLFISVGSGGGALANRYLVMAHFHAAATQGQREDAIDSVAGTVVGDWTIPADSDGFIMCVLKVIRLAM